MTNKLFSLQHIEKMTDSVGMLEHCIFSTPDRTEGYSTDDNARALQVMLRLRGEQSEEYQQKYVEMYLQFLLSARTSEGFHQDLNADFTWKNDDGIEEGFGRVMAALGEASISAPTDDQKLTAAFVFDKQIELIKKVKQNRVMVQVLIGLSYRVLFEKKSQHLVPLLLMRKKLKNDMPTELPINIQAQIVRISEDIANAYVVHSSASWHWYEESLTYDNSRLPLGMLVAYQCTDNKKYLNIALESLDFLLSQTFDNEKECFSFVGYHGWFKKNEKKAMFGQQPIEAGSTVEVCSLAYEITQNKKYLEFAKKALAWYSGRNILRVNLLNETTGGVKDGLEEWGVNPNEGAESVLGYVLACLALKKVV